MHLSLSNDLYDQTAVVRVEGEIDAATAPILREHLGDLLGVGRHHLVVDLCQVEYLDCSGLLVLIDVLQYVRPRRGSVQIVCDRAHIGRIFALTGLGPLFSVHLSLAEAIAALGIPGESVFADESPPAVSAELRPVH